MKTQTSPPTLAEIQNWFRSAITSETFDRVKNHRHASFIEEDSSFSKESRIEIYSVGWFLRLRGCLQDDYEALERTLGEDTFSNLIRAYLKRYPVRSYLLAQIGDVLPEFLEKWDYPGKEEWHTDLARLERCYYQSFWAKNPECWDLSHLAQSAPETMENLELKLESPVFLLKSDWSLIQVWKKKKDKPSPIKRRYLIYRNGFSVQIERVSHKEFQLLNHLSFGCTLGKILDLFPDNQTIQWLSNWASLGIISPNQGG